MNKAEEFAYLMKYAENMNPEIETERGQFIALFTAYCIHRDIELDTDECDRAVDELFDALPLVALRYYGGVGLVARDRFYLEIGKYLC